MQGKVLVVDDEPHIRFIFDTVLRTSGLAVTSVEDYDAAVAAVERESFDLIFSDVRLVGKSGVDLLKELRRRGCESYVLMVTGHPELETAQEALRLGAFDYLTKPVLRETLLRVAHNALSHKSMREEKERYRRNLEAIFRSVKDGIVTVDREAVVLEVNEAAGRLCGIHRNEIGLPIHQVVSARCHAECLNTLDLVFQEKRSVELPRLVCKRAGAAQQMVALTISPLLDEGGGFSGAVMVVRDETRLAALEKDLTERRQFHRLVGQSRAMQDVYALIENLADVETTVLINGESGTGKELVAEAIHHQGTRGNKPLVKVNCAALPETLLESELFGHARGAFTGAVRDKEGRFQMADRGTIFLDEIGDISPRMQTRLLRVLQEKEFERVGDSRTLKVDVRVVVATNQDLRAKVRLGEFREDLYYRLKVVVISLPALRERREDIPLLADHFLAGFNSKFNKSINGFSQRVLKLFMEYPWPGNVREFEHAVEHAFVVCQRSLIDVEDLPLEIRGAPELPAATFPPLAGEEDERDALLLALRETGWVVARAARRLGISRSTIYRKMLRHGIDPDHPQAGFEHHVPLFRGKDGG